MIKLKVEGDKSRERILPVIFNDNFISLMPGESRIIKMELQAADTQGENPCVDVAGFRIENK
jgi:exo-1,4-beta-D-glucosaminidase